MNKYYVHNRDNSICVTGSHYFDYSYSIKPHSIGSELRQRCLQYMMAQIKVKPGFH